LYFWSNHKPKYMTNLSTSPERWAFIEGFSTYEISSRGRVRNAITGLILSLFKSHGYKRINLYKDNEEYKKRVCRLVAFAFVPNPHNKPYVNHKDGIKENDFAENLEWVTAQENTRHRFNVLMQDGSRRKLSKEDVFNILSAEKCRGMQAELSKKFKVTERTIQQVRTGTNYKKWFNEYTKKN
jgi:hypothetical protein